jgi:hypothetical protein
MNDELKSVNVFKFGDPSSSAAGYAGAKTYAAPTPGNSVPGAAAITQTDPIGPNYSTNGKLTPKKGLVVFAAGAKINDCIAAVVRDSEYTRDLLSPESIKKAQAGDGLITYFTVRLEADILDFEPEGNKYLYNFRYVLEPYKIHYSIIQGQQQGDIDVSDLKGKIKRSYDYIYTGKNLDVIKFDLKFDNLYFDAIPAMMGNRPAANDKTQTAGPDNIVDTKKAPLTTESAEQNRGANSVPTAERSTYPDFNQFKSEAKAGQTQSNPFYAMIKRAKLSMQVNVER